MWCYSTSQTGCIPKREAQANGDECIRNRESAFRETVREKTNKAFHRTSVHRRWSSDFTYCFFIENNKPVRYTVYGTRAIQDAVVSASEIIMWCDVSQVSEKCCASFFFFFLSLSPANISFLFFFLPLENCARPVFVCL